MKLLPFSLALSLSCFRLTAETTGDWVQSCDQYLAAQFEHGMFNGYAVVADGGNVKLSKAYGKADYDKDVVCTPDTKFLIGSLTKQFTALLVLQQVQHGTLRLEQTIESFFPQIVSANKVTIRELLNHTSGLPNFTDFSEYATFEETNVTLDDIVRAIAHRPATFEPGTKYAYCNSNYLLLGIILEKVSGESYERLLQHDIFAPAHMVDSGLFFSGRTYEHFATGYTEDVQHYVAAAKPHAEFAFAAGQIYSTANDLLKWDGSLQSDTLLGSELKEQMFTPGKEDYGFGWVIRKTAGMTVEFHSGALPGFRSSFFRIPEKRCAIILLCNMDSPSLTEHIANDLLSYYLGKPYTAPVFHKAIAVAQAVLERYIGKYQVNEKAFIHVTLEDGKLMVRATGQEKHEFYPETDNTFFVKFSDAEITFEKGDRGEVKQAVLLHGGKTITASKVE